MDKRIKWIHHKGTKILMNNYQGLQGELLLNQVDACVYKIKKSEAKGILLLVDIENAEVSKASVIKFTEAAKQIKGKCKKIALVGLTPVKRKIAIIINKMTGLEATGFETEIKAKNWLISR